MSKKAAKKPTGLSNANPNIDRSLSAYPVEPSELERQQSRIKKAATPEKAAAAGKSKPAPAMKVEFPAASAPAAGAVAPQKTSAPVGERSGPGPSALKEFRPEARTSGPAKTAPQQNVQLKIVNVSFALARPSASQVSLCGEFNDWSPDAGPMTRHEDGHWEAIVALRPGRYEYKFLVDGEWLTDPAVAQTVRNQFGSLNSVIVVES